MRFLVMAMVASAVCFGTVVTVPEFLTLADDLDAALAQYPEAVGPALNQSALAVQAELTALGSDTDLQELAIWSIRKAGKDQAVRNLRATLTEKMVEPSSSAWQDLDFLDKLQVTEAENLMAAFPEGRGLWVYSVEPSPNTGNAYWYKREWWEVVRTRYTATDRIDLKKTERMNASSIMTIEELKASDMWTLVE